MPSQNIHFFPCTACGACCKYLHLAEELQEFDRGDGTCIHLLEPSNRCAIYETRPDICNIQKQYELHYKETPWNEFVQENLQICEALQLDQKAKTRFANSDAEIRKLSININHYSDIKNE